MQPALRRPHRFRAWFHAKPAASRRSLDLASPDTVNLGMHRSPNGGARRGDWPCRLVVGTWSFIGHWSLVIGHSAPQLPPPPAMKTHRSPLLHKLANLFSAPPQDPYRYAQRLKTVERDVILPIKAVFIAVLATYFFGTPWFGETGLRLPRSVALEVVQAFLLIYTVLNVAAAVLLLTLRRWPFKLVHWVIFGLAFVDGLFVAALTLVTGGYDSILYWLFVGLVVRNAVSNPLARPQIILNLSVVFSYMLAGALDLVVTSMDIAQIDEVMRRTLEISLPENPAETFLLRLIILVPLSAWCYGVQAIFERDRRAVEESRESASRQEQLRAAGRLAAEIAHKIKNPLGIINNAAFSIQRAIEQNRKPSPQQAQIIREEVERADRIITELMGYAQLAEGQVERLNVVAELNRAILTVFPPGARYSVQLHTDFADDIPPLLMQRTHFAEVVVNILQNAREALGGLGEIHLRAWCRDETVYVSIRDDGPGVPPEKLQRIFEPYFSTKDKGTGLGLAIARHNAEMYQGKLHAKSKPGEGAEFILELPTRTFMKLRT